MSESGILYVAATPIGNMEDITLRAIRILNAVDLIAAEDTRHTANLLRHHGIQTPLISCHEHNERERTPELIRKLREGKSVAIVSDAGTPSVSDPGYRLVREAADLGIQIVPIPGASAAMTAVSAAGLPTDAFVFCGFPPKKAEKRSRMLANLNRETGTLIFYEAPNRIVSFIEDIIREMGDRRGVLAREMTKIHEEFLRGHLSEIADILKQRSSVKGECTLLVQGKDQDEQVSPDQIRSEIIDNFKRSDITVSALVKTLAEKYDIPKKIIYQEALTIKKNMELSGSKHNEETP